MLRGVLTSVSVDLDPLGCYHAIYGMAPPPPALRDVVLERALPRFLALFARLGLRATLFVVGSDGEREPGRSLLRDAARAGHELGNHSHTHPYDLSRRGAAGVAAELGACDQVLRQILAEAGVTDGGGRPWGFRSPGYDLTPVQLRAAADLGYRYDSSLFPCPPYYAAKATVMLGLAALGRPSRSVLTDPRSQIGPTLPYRPDLDHPYRRGSASIVELPVAVTPWLRLPAIGTYLLLSERLRRFILWAMRRRPFFNLELHGLDLIGAAEDGIPAALVRRQADLRVPLTSKLAALTETLTRLRAESQVVPLYQIAARYFFLGERPGPGL